MNSTENNNVNGHGLTGRIFWMLVSLALGLVGGVFLHYLFYRLSLPIEPFIYVSF